MQGGISALFCFRAMRYHGPDMSVFEAMFSGFVIGLVLAVPAFVSETIHHGRNLPLLMDVKTFWGARLSPDAVLWWSVAVHLLMSTLFGGAYALLATRLPGLPWSPGSLALYGLGYYVVTGGVLLPMVGLGVFGRREGGTVWLELLLATAGYAALLGLLAHLFFLG